MIFKQDFQPPRKSFSLSARRRSRRPGRRSLSLIVAAMIIAIVGFLLSHSADNAQLEARVEPLEVRAPVTPQPVKQESKKLVQPGETVTALLGDYFSPAEILELNERSRDVYPFSRLCAGRPYSIFTLDGSFESFVYDIDDEQQLVLRRSGDETLLEKVPIVYDVERELVRGVIKTSLIDAVIETGEDVPLAIALADIFAWDIDFILDLRVGDSFMALVEKRFRDGEPAGYGRVLAAEFVNQKKRYSAFRYQDGDQHVSYYDAEGRNVRKAFLKAPLEFSRISSGFTMKRFHPVTKTWKAHPAIDYAAAPGTPIKTVGDGSIKRIGYTKGNGNFIEVRHSNGYSTLYLHMQNFARGMSKGKKLRQGQVIGYVGSTGLATGPHLCFRMRKNGAPVNPTRIKVPAAKSVTQKNMADFNLTAAPFIALFDEKRQQELVLASVAQPETGTAESAR